MNSQFKQLLPETKPTIVLTDYLAMQMPSKNSRIYKASTPKKHVKFIAMALPLAVTIGCGHKSEIIDYTISEAEYAALTAPAPAPTIQPAVTEEQIASVMEETQSPPQIVLATAPPKLPAATEPVMAAALPEVPWTETPADELLEPTMAAAKPAMPSITASEISAAEMSSAEMHSAPGIEAALEATAALEEKVAELEALTIQPAKTAEPELAAAIATDRLGFTPSVYTTLGLGVSRMNPDTSAAEGYEPNDLTEPAGQFGLGVDIARFLSVEAHTADYGSTSLTPDGRIGYEVNGVSALIYAGKNLNRFKRRGLNGYARIGYNQIKNTTIDGAPFLERTANHASFGIGAEYTTRFGLGLRGDLIAYDGDVQYGQLGVLYRLASKPTILPTLAAAAEAPAAPESNYPPLEASAAKSQEPMPSMKKPAMLPQLRYANEYSSGDNCSMLNGTLSNVTFMTGSAELTYGANNALNDVANTLMDCADRQIVVSAHTDSNGSAAANDSLSKRRARAVAMHLASRGIEMNRIRAVAYGESRPVASNATPEGRNRNRRVELEVR